MHKRVHDENNAQSVSKKSKPDTPFYIWAMIIPFLHIKDIVKMASVSKGFVELVNTPSVWSDYFSFRGIKFTSPELREAVIGYANLCFIYIKTLVATNVLQEFLDVECTEDSDQGSFLMPVEDPYLQYWPSIQTCNIVCRRRILEINSLEREIVIESKLWDDYKEMFSFMLANISEHEEVEKCSLWENNLELHVGTRNLQETIEYITEWNKKNSLEEHSTEIVQWKIAYRMLKYFRLTEPLYENGSENDLKAVRGFIDQNEFWYLISFELKDGIVDIGPGLLDLLGTFLHLTKGIQKYYTRLHTPNNRIPENHFKDYITSTFEHLISKHMAMY